MLVTGKSRVLAGAGIAGGMYVAARVLAQRRVHGIGLSRRYRFNAAYHEQVCLRDGAWIRLRLVRPTDKSLLRDGMRRASPETRYRRFLVPKPSLSESELRYLTEIDGIEHFAIGAIRRRLNEEGIGIARFVRLREDSTDADAALAVRDDWQNRGLGRILLTRLVEAARERGIRTLRCDILSVNESALRLFRTFDPNAQIHRFGPTIQIELAVPA